MFDTFPKRLKEILLDLEKNYKVVRRIKEGNKEGILLNPDFYNNCQSQIDAPYNETEKAFIHYIFSLNINFLHYKYVLLNYNYYYNKFKKEVGEEVGKEVTPISTPKERDFLSEKQIGFLGLPKTEAIENGFKGGEVLVSNKLVDLPYEKVGETLKKRKEDFGIWISQDGIRHFESLRCEFSATDPIFSKIEHYFKPEYSAKNVATPIDTEKRDALGICFSMAITKYGNLTLYLKGKHKDVEKFASDFFTTFKPCLTDEEIIKLVEMLYLSRNKGTIFKIHDARTIGDKKTVDAKFKGAYIKVNEIHWFGGVKYDAYIDYSVPMSPHLEALGPAEQVGNFLSLTDGNYEFISNLTEIRHLSYDNRSVAKETYRGVGHLSKELRNNHQDQMHYLSEIEITNDNRHLQNQILLTGVSHQVEKTNKLNLETLSEIREYNEFSKDAIEKIYYPLNVLTKSSRRIAFNMSRLAHNLSVVSSVIPEVQEDVKGTIYHAEQLIIDTSNQTDTLIEKKSKEILDKIDAKSLELQQSVKEIISTEIKSRSESLKQNLETILSKLSELPGLTAKELYNELKVSSKTIYNYLTELKANGLISEVNLKNGKKGRPRKLYSLSSKILNKLKKRDV